MKRIAHRGGATIYPEQTIISAKLAMDKGADLIEIDVRFTKDKKIAVSHDSNAKRVFGLDKEITDMSAEEFLALRHIENHAFPSHLFEDYLLCGIKKLLIHIKEDDVVLVKASRGMKLENLINIFESKYRDNKNFTLQIKTFKEDPTLENNLKTMGRKYKIEKAEPNKSDDDKMIKIMPWRSKLILDSGFEIVMGLSRVFYPSFRPNLHDEESFMKMVELYDIDLNKSINYNDNMSFDIVFMSLNFSVYAFIIGIIMYAIS